MIPSQDAILLLTFGAPETSADIEPFLAHVARSRRIPAARLKDVARHYGAIGGRSPLNDITRRQAEGLRQQLAASGAPARVYIGQRHWHPWIEDTLRQMREDGVHEATAIILAPHHCEASVDRYWQAVAEARAKIGATAPLIRFIGDWHDHPLFIEAIADRVNALWCDWTAERRRRVCCIFTAHSIPARMAEESPYTRQLARTAALVSARLGIHDWTLAYSSRSGDPQEAWLEPDVCGIMAPLAERHVQDVLLIPIGFVADHVEVLYDLDIEARQMAESVGIRLHRAPTVGDHPAFLRMLAQLVQPQVAS